MKYLLSILLLLFSALCRAESGQVYVVLSDDTPVYQQASREIVDALTLAQADLSVSTISIAQFQQLSPQANDLVVPLGSTASIATQHLSRDAPVIYSLIERQDLPHPAPKSWAAVVIDQPITRLLAVAEKVSKDRYHNTIIVAVSDSNQSLIDEISALDSSIKPQMLIIRADQEPAKEIDKVLFEAGALIAVRDDRIWSGENAKWMLYQSFKYHVPVIGYSKKFLKAGALASVYATLTQTTAKTVELILDWQRQPEKPLAQEIVYPDFNIEYNAHIARTLNLTLPVDDE